MTGIRNLFQIAERPPLLSGLLATITCLAAGTPVSGAERIQFFYGPFEPTIYVTELEAVAQGDFTDIGGVLSSQLTEQQLQALQAALNYRLEVDLPTLTRLTSSAVGQKLLLRIGQVVQTDNLLNGSNAISAALILAAAQERDLTLLAIVKHFPLETIQLNLPLLIRLLEENEQLFQRQGDVVQTIQQQAAAQSADVVLAESLDLSLAGPHRWEVETFSFQTPGRPTSAPADLYLPETANSSVPVVVISHGMASDRTSFVYLAEHLASHGFAVIVPEHIDSSTQKFAQFLGGLEGPPQPESLIQRPQDITAVLNELELRRATDSRLALLNLQAVGVLGHSLGGYTALAIGGANLTRLGLASACDGSVEEQPILNLSLLLQCRFLELPQGLPDLRDNRVQAVLAINPLTSHLFGPTGMEQLDVPTLLVASTDDYFVPPLPEQIEPFNWMTMTDKYLLVIHNGTHFTPLEAGEEIFPVPDFLLGADQSSAQPVLQAQTLAFFQRYLLNQAEVENYLSQSYLERFNSDAFTYSIQRGYSRSDRDLRLHP